MLVELGLVEQRLKAVQGTGGTPHSGQRTADRSTSVLHREVGSKVRCPRRTSRRNRASIRRKGGAQWH